MGSLRFRLPTGLSPDATRDLGRACVAGGFDNMPAPARATVTTDQLLVTRDSEDSGYLLVPWHLPGTGRLMASSGTLTSRSTPYHLPLELARGKVNQVRCQAADWVSIGVSFPSEFDDQLRVAGHLLSQAICAAPDTASAIPAQEALHGGFEAAEQLVRLYAEQLFQARHARQPQLDTLLGIRINGTVPPTVAPAVAAACNSVALPLSWRSVEPTESNYRWEPTDTALAWAERCDLRAVAGPLIDFSPRGLPDWLWLWEGDLQSIASFMCDYVETAVGRYRSRIRRWQLTAGANMAEVLKLGEEDLLWLTARLAEAAWQVDPDLELVIGLAKPWGDYMARKEYTYSPFIFADTLIRAGLRLTAVDLEWIMGVDPRGSYCRDLLDSSRLLDLFAMLGVSAQVTLAYPAATSDDALADPVQEPGLGCWREGFTPEIQADWAEAFTRIALSKPFVRGVYWAQLTDSEDHPFPNCGLVDPSGRARPALARLQGLREQHLR